MGGYLRRPAGAPVRYRGARVIPEAAVAFVADLLRTDKDSINYRVGAQLWPALGDGSRDDVMTTLRDLMYGSALGSRTNELAHEVFYLLDGRGVAA